MSEIERIIDRLLDEPCRHEGETPGYLRTHSTCWCPESRGYCEGAEAALARLESEIAAGARALELLRKWQAVDPDDIGDVIEIEDEMREAKL